MRRSSGRQSRARRAAPARGAAQRVIPRGGPVGGRDPRDDGRRVLHRGLRPSSRRARDVWPRRCGGRHQPAESVWMLQFNASRRRPRSMRGACRPASTLSWRGSRSQSPLPRHASSARGLHAHAHARLACASSAPQRRPRDRPTRVSERVDARRRVPAPDGGRLGRLMAGLHRAFADAGRADDGAGRADVELRVGRRCTAGTR